MPRNSGGTYTLPAGNPVVTLTVISSSWANTTLVDLSNAMTDSLSRSGQGGMSAPLALADGLVGAPGLTWGNEPTSGLYRAGAGDFRYSIASVDKVQVTTNGVRVVNGVLGAPSLSFISDTDTGLFLAGANSPSMASAGVETMRWGSGGYFTVDGTVGVPAWSFLGDVDTGLYRAGSNDLRVALGGAESLRLTTANPSATLGLSAVNGTSTIPMRSDAAPALSQSISPTWTGTHLFTTSTAFTAAGTGGTSAPVRISNNLPVYALDEVDGGANQRFTRIYNNAASFNVDFLNDAENASGQVVTVTRSGITAGTATWGVTQHLSADGSAGSPSYAFSGDTDTGIYRSGSNQVAIGGNGGVIAVFTGGSPNTIQLTLNTATSASAGGATALPATPEGYLFVTINGTARKIPYYGV